MQPYFFYRMHNGKEMFYPVELIDDNAAVVNAEHNKGTTMVTKVDGTVVWINPTLKQ